jgi:hypothetical protein
MSLPSVIFEFMAEKKDYSEYKIKKGTKPMDDPYFQFADDFNTDYETSPITLDGQVNPKWVAQFEEE